MSSKSNSELSTSTPVVTVEEKILEPPQDVQDFNFPFEPYTVQIDFMKALFTALERRKLGIFESPTGTGKSLSLLCGSLTWLEKRDEARLEYLQKVVESVDIIEEEKNAKAASDWIQAQHRLRQKRELVNASKREITFLQDLSQKRKKYLTKKSSSLQTDVLLRRRKNETKKNGKKEGDGKSVQSVEDELDDLLLNDDFAPALDSDLDLSDGDDDGEPEFYPNKIIFASRTHSQLSQFANELKRTAYASRVTSCSLGSRQNLCINPEVTKLKNLSLMNERCLELQKGNKGKKTSDTKKMKTGCGGCQYFNQIGIDELKNEILSQPMDIEDLVTSAKELNACPYYASRKASKEAQLVMLPYNTILHKSTREGVGLKVRNAVLIFDEAHNIIEAISNMYSTSVTSSQLEDCALALKTYMQRYMSRFNPKHLLKLKQLSFMAKALQKFLDAPSTGKSVDGSATASLQNVFTIQEFKMEADIDNLDIYELQSFLKKSKLIFKLKGYLIQRQKIEEKKAEADSLKSVQSKPTKKLGSKAKPQSTTATLKQEEVKPKSTFRPQSGQSVLNFAEFLKSLLTAESGGRVIRDGKTLKFLLLSTCDHFTDLLLSSRSIVLAGGTMKPYDEVEDQLFSPAKERIFHFSCDHVIPDENLVCIALNHGPTSTLFDFTYQNRKTSAILEELSRTIMNLAKIVPGGLVCFLPSYEYESTLNSFLKQAGYLDKIDSRKKIFREPKDSSCDVVLNDYSRQIRNSEKGALLFAVVGGKLSEGINFSDDLGRCVLVVGLPYPNVTSVEIKEKVQFVSDRFGKEKGSQLLPNLCSKAVNQSVGRAIRHANDYAVIILVDHRFSRSNQQALLPDWIRKRSQVCDTFGPAIATVSRFFAIKKMNKKISTGEIREV